ncbi:MAG: TlyA family RNA methyltransferase [Acidimicrobiales bacterium]|nr:TlyA family RNA methyltransferase [Acidimicrobiales bacterium]
MAGRRRLDAELVRRRLAESRTHAARLVDSGRVLVGGASATKSSRLVGSGEPVTVTGPPPRYVSRGGEKLEAALNGFSIDVAGQVALDAGASTGGFTDCLLQAGAAHVVAVDVGRGQLHEKLRADPRVDVRERTDIRSFAPPELARDGFPVVVADLSFISVRSVAQPLMRLAAPAADVVVLVKPQFEAGRVEASRGRGVIRDASVWQRVLLSAIAALEEAGAANMGVMVSPLRGTDGNVEFLTWFRAGAEPGGVAGTRVDAAIGSVA